MAYPVPVRRLLLMANPVECPPWNCKTMLVKNDVLSAIAANALWDAPIPPDGTEDPYVHAQRIAWLVTHGWDDPIDVDVGIPGLGYCPEWPIIDGNHRLYAAVIRGDKKILASVSGDLCYAAKRLGIKARLLEE